MQNFNCIVCDDPSNKQLVLDFQKCILTLCQNAARVQRNKKLARANGDYYPGVLCLFCELTIAV